MAGGSLAELNYWRQAGSSVRLMTTPRVQVIQTRALSTPPARRRASSTLTKCLFATTCSGKMPGLAVPLPFSAGFFDRPPSAR
jgi:hypothetical protein